ncbi:hypothetical protein HYU14_07355 [Candidatus Woesearchaeota archaeon]|nr:hypothetical protein [Candidatus Woesearchaeota archaeon]
MDITPQEHLMMASRELAFRRSIGLEANLEQPLFLGTQSEVWKGAVPGIEAHLAIKFIRPLPKQNRIDACSWLKEVVEGEGNASAELFRRHRDLIGDDHAPNSSQGPSPSLSQPSPQSPIYALTGFPKPYLAGWPSPQIFSGGDLFGVIAFEYIGMPNLHRLSREIRLSYPEVLDIGDKAAAGLEIAHSLNMLFGDLKPNNLLVERNARNPPGRKVILIDWPRHEGNPSLPYLLTPGYAAPELLMLQYFPRSISSFDPFPQSDVFGLAATLFDVLTGNPPYTAQAQEMFLLSQRNQLAMRPFCPQVEVPRGAEGVIMKGLAYHPKDRFSTPLEMMDAFPRMGKVNSR